MKTVSTLWLSIVLLLFITVTTSSAQEKQPFRMGFQLQEVGSDFGLGLNADLPLPGKLPVLRLSGAWHWLEIAPENRTQTASFGAVRLGLASRGWSVAEQIRVYGEGGVLFLLPASTLAENDLATGGYGLFGFEFLTAQQSGSALFLEIGGTGAGSRLKRREQVPAFGAGMILSAGFRMGFR